MTPILATHTWVSLPNEVRYRIRALFEIPKSGFSEVSDGVILSDGVTQTDFKALTIDKMQVYLNDNSVDFHKLFDKVVAKVNDEISGKVPLILSQEKITPSVWAVNAVPIITHKMKKNGKKK
jgi:hypothetical protein